MNRAFTSTDRQRLKAEQIASYGAEQRRLKAEAADRRAAVALRAASDSAKAAMEAAGIEPARPEQTGAARR